MFNIDKFKKDYTKKAYEEANQIALNAMGSNDLSSHAGPDIFVQYPPSRKVVWPEHITGQGFLIAANSDIIPIAPVSRSGASITDPTPLSVFRKFSSDSNFLAVQNSSVLATVFPVQSGSKLEVGPRPDTPSTAKSFFKVPFPKYPRQRLSPIPIAFLVDLRRPLPSSFNTQYSSVSLTSVSGGIITLSSSVAPKPARIEKDLTNNTESKELGLCDELHTHPISHNVPITTTLTGSTQSDIIISHEVLLSDDSALASTTPTLGFEDSTRLDSMQPIEPSKVANDSKPHTINHTNPSHSTENIPATDSDSSPAPETICDSTPENEVTDVGVLNALTPLSAPGVTVAGHENQTVEGLVKSEHHARSALENSPTKIYPLVEITISSPSLDTLSANKEIPEGGRATAVYRNEAEMDLIDLPSVGFYTMPGAKADLDGQTTFEPPSHLKKNNPKDPLSNVKASSLNRIALPLPQRMYQAPSSESSSLNKKSFTSITPSPSIDGSPIDQNIVLPLIQPHLVVSQLPDVSSGYIPPHLRSLPPHLRPAPAQRTESNASSKNPSQPNTRIKVSVISYHSDLTGPGSPKSPSTVSSNSTGTISKKMTSRSRRVSATTGNSDESLIGGEKGVYSDTSESSGIKTPSELEVAYPIILENSPPRYISTNHTPVINPPKPSFDAQNYSSVAIKASISKFFIQTEKGLVDLPIIFTSCNDKGCSFIKYHKPCGKSHAKAPRFYIPFNKPICSEFVQDGSCSAGGKSCQRGAHPCASRIRFNKCHNPYCPFDHSITINSFGSVYSRLLEEPKELPMLNILNQHSSITYKSRTEYNLDPPGISTKLGPRNNNDWADFTRISILPTVDEIVSTRPVYLPHKVSAFCAHDVFDIGFRHQREASLGQVRLALSRLIGKMMRGDFISGSTNGEEPVCRVYRNCVVMHSFVEQCRIPILNFGLRFFSPGKEQMRDETVLRAGHLLALLIQSGQDISLVWLQATEPWTNRDTEGKISTIGHVNARMVDIATQKKDLEKLLSLQSSQRTCLLVDFGGVLPATFIHVLSSIQTLDRDVRSSFANNLFQRAIPEIMFHTPRYLQDNEIDFSPLGFEYKCRLGPGRVGQGLLTSIRNRLSQNTSNGISLTTGQRDALINSLTSRVSFVQGPPGTGKSFIGRTIIKMLASNRRAWKDNITTPILLTAQTNHALDETISSYIKCGLKVARLGITPGSQSPNPEHIAFQNHILPNDVQEPIRKAYNQARKQSEVSSKELEFLISEITNTSVGWRRLGPFLRKEYPEFFKAFLKISSDGREAEGFLLWSKDDPQVQKDCLLAGLKATIPEGFKGSGSKINELESNSPDPSSKVDGEPGLDLWKFTPVERQELISQWKEALDSILNSKIESARATLKESSHEMLVISAKEKAAKIIAFGIDVVACTSTRVASDLELLKHLEIEVAIVEEAGEIVEPMVLPIFGSRLQHLIMIGDHQQLKPFCNTPGLAGGDYKQDQSLFERLVSPTIRTPRLFPLALLDCQRRMRPEIAGLVRSLRIYKAYTDGDNVKLYPDVPTMGGKNLLWLNHASPESFSGRSYWNSHEASMIAEHAAHLFRSGEFGIRDIVILTPYREQVSAIIRCLRRQEAYTLLIPAEDIDSLVTRNVEYRSLQDSGSKDPILVKVEICDAIQVTTIDNYQGQEANVVLYSAVRSNNNGRLGFTDITNRACVTLSRARHGMYIYANAETAWNSKDSWNKVIRYMESQKMVVSGLPVQKCSYHSSLVHTITCQEDWDKLRSSRCVELRSVMLPCGHIYDLLCGTSEARCPNCKVQLEERKSVAEVAPNISENIKINIFPLNISELDLEGNIEGATASGHEQWFLDASRYFLANAYALGESFYNGEPSRMAFLKGLNLSRNGDKENEWRFSERYSVLRSFPEKYEIGLKQATTLEKNFGVTGLVSRMENFKRTIRDAIVDDYNAILCELMRLAKPHNNVRTMAEILRQALQEKFE